MPIGLIIFVAYLIIMIFSRFQQQAKIETENKKGIKSEFKTDNFAYIPDKKIFRGKMDEVKTADIINGEGISPIDDEVISYYQQKDLDKTKEKYKKEEYNHQISLKSDKSFPSISDNNLINGIIFSELIGRPKALRSTKNRS